MTVATNPLDALTLFNASLVAIAIRRLNALGLLASEDLRLVDVSLEMLIVSSSEIENDQLRGVLLDLTEEISRILSNDSIGHRRPMMTS